jgi:xylulose-5-phosphate/fructose-6-phosphate phosphoketolase
MLKQWMRSYRPEEFFDQNGAPVAELRESSCQWRHDRSLARHSVVGRLRRAGRGSGRAARRIDAAARREAARHLPAQRAQANFCLFCPEETNSNRLGEVFEVENWCLVSRIQPDDDHVSPDGCVMEVLSEHSHQAWLEGYTLTGRHGLFATYEAFAMIVDSMVTQHAKWLKSCVTELSWRKPIPSLNYLLISTCWRNDHNGFSRQGPGFIDTLLTKQGSISRIYLPPDANCLLSVADQRLRSRNYINLTVIDKQSLPVCLDIDAARHHCSLGATIWQWAGTDERLC